MNPILDSQAMITFSNFVETYRGIVFYAIAILVIGIIIAKIIRKIIGSVMESRKVDPTITAFTLNLSYIAMVAFVVLAAMNKVGIETDSFVMILGAAGLAIGLALQGSLSNFASGFLMLIFRPINVGNYVNAGGSEGIVEKIEVFTTTLKTLDNRTVIIPNSAITSGNIINFSVEKTRRVDLTIGVSYADDLDKVRAILKRVAEADSRILKDPAPDILVSEMADSSVNFAFRLWVENANYWPVYFGATEAVKKALDAEGVSIPFPQTDVHFFPQAETAN